MFALCVENRDCEDLEKRKIYQFYYLHLPPEAEVALKEIVRSGWEDAIYRWVLKRFMEYGRVVDTFKFFSVNEIARALEDLPLSPYAKEKWHRMIEIYGRSNRR
ncbi:MAG: hypothetical protein JRI51_12995 [Deltaproteobacteria bacterium]|nr:hypothetical protein [Deltaproteobacteria bacterium]